VIRLERRAAASPHEAVVVPALSVAAALLCGAALFALAGVSPLAAYATLVSDPFGSVFGWTETTVKAIPLILTALAVLLPARMRPRPKASPMTGKELEVSLRHRYIATCLQNAMCWVRFFDFRSASRIWKKSATVFWIISTSGLAS
jgi:hypothetical protein